MIMKGDTVMLSKEKINDILELYVREGLTTGEIAEKVGCTESEVVEVLRKHHYIND